MKVKNNCDLKSCYLCKHSLPAWIPAIEGNRKVLHFTKGEVLFKEGETVNGMYFVYSGLVKVHKKWGSEKELIVRFAKKGDILGHRGLGADNVYPITATALQPVSVCHISLDFFYDSFKVNQKFALQLLDFFATELKLSEQRMRNLAHMPVKGRIATALLNLQSKFGVTDTGNIDVAITRQDFASYAGTTYETVFRVMTEFTEAGLINTAEKDIKIVDELALKTIADEGS